MRTAPSLVPLLLMALVLPLARAEEGALEDPNDPVAVIRTSLGEIHVELFVREAPKTVESFLGLAEGTKAFKDLKTGAMVKRPYYDGLIFHRVIAGFMVQGGCPRGDGRGSPGFTFADEIDAQALGLAGVKAIQPGRLHPWLGMQPAEFRERIVLPLYRQLGISSQAQLDERKAEVDARLQALTLKDAYELMGYRYTDGVGAHKPTKGVLAMANTGPDSNGSQFFLNLRDTDWLTGKHTVFGKVVRGMDVLEKIGQVQTNPDDKPLEDVKILSIRRRVDPPAGPR